jgi:hypothetical protein
MRDVESVDRSEAAPGLPGFWLAALAAGVLLLAMAVGERAGLPGGVSWPIGFVVIALAAAAAILLSRTAVERRFLGRDLLLGPLAGGLVLGAVVAGASFHLVRPTTSRDLAAATLGAAIGLVAAHVAARMRRGSRLLIGEAGGGAEGAPSLIQGLIIAGAGAAIAAAALPATRDAVTLLTGWSPMAALLAAAATPAFAVAVAGLRGLLALGGALAVLMAAGLALTTWLGLTQLGAPPLPGLSQADVLLAIAGARTRLFPSDTLPFLASWLPPEGVTGLVFSSAFLAGALLAALIGRAATPGLPLHRPATLVGAVAAQALLLVGLAAMAGYAVEAAGLQFVGASLQNPAPGLLEASRQGLAEFCGARPVTLDQLRTACGLAPRAQGTLDLARIRLSEPFLWTGVPVALGAPVALAAPARLGPAAFPMLGVAAGFWLIALGLGRGVLGRGRIAPGLASHRLALVRLAAVMAAAALPVALTQLQGPLAVMAPASLLAALALGLDLLQQKPAADAAPSVQRPATSRRSATPRDAAQSA